MAMLATQAVTVPTVIHAYIPYIKDVENGSWAREAGCAAAPGAVTGVGLWRPMWRVWARVWGAHRAYVGCFHRERNRCNYIM